MSYVQDELILLAKILDKIQDVLKADALLIKGLTDRVTAIEQRFDNAKKVLDLPDIKED